jgi:hypothetical protein
MTYIPNDEEIKMLLKQTSLTKNEANNLLIKYSGDITECILETFEYVKPDITEDTNDEVKDKLLEFRKILDEKDTIFCKILEEKNKCKQADKV